MKTGIRHGETVRHAGKFWITQGQLPSICSVSE
jgi:hypothetical protein